MRRAIFPTPPGLLSAVALLALSGAAGCDGEPAPPPGEVVLAREQAERAACAADELLQRASDNAENLQEALAGTAEGGSMGAGTAALEFARAYLQHAQLRAAQLAHLDSAYDDSQRAADSVRHLRVAQDLAARQPEPGTVEANVRASFDRNFRAVLQDPDHPCNWDLED